MVTVIVIGILVASVLILNYLGFFQPVVPPPGTNARSGFSADYDYVTQVGAVTDLNKFTVSVTRIDGSKVYFTYLQTVSTNTTTSSSQDNYSIAFDPTNSESYTAGSALPLFVSNSLSEGNGTATVATSAGAVPVPINYSIITRSGQMQISLRYYSGSKSQVGAYITWSLNYNETTGLLERGSISLVSTLFAYTNLTYTMTSFQE